jgi:hypothetical protein
MQAVPSRLLLALLLVSLSLASAVQQTPQATAATFCESNPTDTWCVRAGIAWKYFQPSVGWNSATGLSYDSANWHLFTLWGLASYVLALVAAKQILPSSSWGSYSFGSRVDLILDFIDPAHNLSFRASSQVPYLVFYADTTPHGAPDIGSGTTNPADYGRLLISLYILKNYLANSGVSGDSARAVRLDTLVTAQNNVPGVRALAYVGNDIYAYYVAQGFRLWPDFADQSWTETSFRDQVANGPFVDPSLMYGVSGIPSGMQIVSEIQLNTIMELNGIQLVTGSSTKAWPAFYGLASRIMQVQWNRWAQTGRLTAWSEGALAHDYTPDAWAPGFVYENIVDPVKGMTWVVTDPSYPARNILWTQTGGPTSYGGYDTTHLPIVFTKVGLGFQALYGDNAFTNALSSALSNKYNSAKGFKEGVWEGDPTYIDGAFNVQTNEAILTAAAYKLLKNFDITVTPQPGSSWTIGTGSQASFTVTASLNPAYTGHTLTLQLTGYSGIYNFNPSTLSGSTWASTLTIQAGSTPGVYPVSISAVDENGYTSVVGATLNIVGPDFSISANPQSLLIPLGSSATSTISITYLSGFSGQVALTASTSPSLTANLNPASRSSSGSSTLTVSTTTTTGLGNYQVTVTGSGGGKTHSVNLPVTVGRAFGYFGSTYSSVMAAPANSVYFIFPDGNHAHPKPSGVGYASVTDWTALGYVYGMMDNMPQITALDTNSTYIDQTTGAPKIHDSIIVLFAGSLVNEVVHYYEVNRVAPLWWSLEGSWSTGTLYYRTSSGAVAASMPIQTVGGGSADMMLVEAFTDANGNTVLIFSGFGWEGTFTSGFYMKNLVYSGALAGMTDAWYFYSWTDKNGNGFVEDYEVNPTPVNHGN